MTNSTRLGLNLSATLLGLVSLLSAQTTCADEFQGLGDLPGGDFLSTANASSADGSVIVGISSSSSGSEAYRWTSVGGMVGLSDLPGGEFNSFATGISGDGSVVVGQGASSAGTEAFLWTMDSGMVGLGDLPGGSFFSRAIDVSSDGSIVVGQSSSADANEAFRWTKNDGLVGLGDLPGGNSISFATGISADGSTIVGQSSFEGFNDQAIRWTSGDGMEGIGDLSGGEFDSGAEAASHDGSVIVGQSESSIGNLAFRWSEETGMVSLGDLPGGAFASVATSVGSDGWLVVGSSSTDNGQEAFVWDPVHEMRNLNHLMQNEFQLPVAGWTLSFASDVSADGLTLIGLGINPDGNLEAWRARFDPRWVGQASGDWDDQQNWILGVMPNETHDLAITPQQGLIVDGPASSATVASLVLGAQTNGVATLNMPTGGSLTSLDQITITSRGKLTGHGFIHALSGIDNAGEINLTANSLQLTGGTLTNSGLIRGNGNIDNDLVNLASGQIRVASGQQLSFTSTAAQSSAGIVEAIGGEVEFAGPLTNVASTGLIAGRDATLRFGGGLANDGAIALSIGTSDVHGDITNAGSMVVTGGAGATFYDDVTNNGTLQVSSGSTAVFLGALAGEGTTGSGEVFLEGDTRPGASPGLMNFGGDVHFGPLSQLDVELGGTSAGTEYDSLAIDGSASLGGTLNVSTIDLGNGLFTPQAGDSFEILVAAGGINGVFDSEVLPGLDPGLLWDLDYTSNAVTASVLAEFLAGDYNGNGQVEQADLDLVLLNWGQSTPPIPSGWTGNLPNGPIDQGELDAVLLNWGSMSGSALQASAVPEPRCIVLTTLGALAALIMTMHSKPKSCAVDI